SSVNPPAKAITSSTRESCSTWYTPGSFTSPLISTIVYDSSDVAADSSGDDTSFDALSSTTMAFFGSDFDVTNKTTMPTRQLPIIHPYFFKRRNNSSHPF